MSTFRPEILFAVALIAAPGWCQEPQPKAEASTQEPESATEPRKAGPENTLRTLIEALATRREDLAEKQRRLPSASDQDKVALQAAIKKLLAEAEKLETDFETLATGIDAQYFAEPSTTPFDLQSEIESLLKPLVHELKEATEDPRQMERLRTEVAHHTQRLQMAKSALQGLARLRVEKLDSAVAAKVEELEQLWQRRLADANNNKQIAEHQLESRRAQRKSLFESTSTLFGSFFRSRGLNLVLALTVLVTVFFGLRFLSAPVRRQIRRRRKDRAQVYVRVFTVVFHLAVGTFATVAALLVLYAAGDWVLLGLALLFLLGLAWASKSTLPRFFEQTRILLNLGAVREGERVLHNGLPFRVERLGVYTLLANPELSGGTLRLPIRDLIDMHSRPDGDRELWFPCREGDWVLLSDGTRGKVIVQTPEMVQLVQLGGSTVVYQTTSFLGMNPQNLSKNFRVSVTFGVDYAHQRLATTEIPRRMRERLETELTAIVGSQSIQNIAVEFQQAGASSLDYAAIADFHGDVAARSDFLRRAIQRILVDACNDHGWTIPFTQITLHQAG